MWAGKRRSPDAWARKAIGLYELEQADCIIAENNYGGDMVNNRKGIISPVKPMASRAAAVPATWEVR